MKSQNPYINDEEFPENCITTIHHENTVDSMGNKIHVTVVLDGKAVGQIYGTGILRARTKSGSVQINSIESGVRYIVKMTRGCDAKEAP